MRELEFLPDWYPRLWKRKRTVGVQAYATVILLTGLCAWGWLSGRNVQAASASLVVLSDQINQANNELHRLEEAVAKKNELESKKVILGKLGNHVESTRILSAIEAAMPEEMSMLNLTAEVKETPRAMPGLAAVLASQSNQQLMDRRLEINVLGVGPTDAMLARFMRALGDSGLFDHISMSFAQERVENNHVMRQFAVTFGIDLNANGLAGGSGRGVR